MSFKSIFLLKSYTFAKIFRKNAKTKKFRT